jgi:cell division protein FtsQ
VTAALQSIIPHSVPPFSLKIQRIEVEGRSRTSADAVRAAIAVRQGAPFFAVDPWAIRRRLEALPWIRSAEVERRYPATLAIRLVERNPIARFRDGHATRLIDENGAVVPVSATADHQQLMLLAGPGAPRAAPRLLEVLGGEGELARGVVTATRYGDRRWDLSFANGVMLRLPEGYERAAWAKFAALNKQYNFLGNEGVTYDMRLPDRLVIRGAAAPPGAAPAENSPKRQRKAG